MKRSGFAVMTRLLGMVKPLTGFMCLAIFMGIAGHICATFITVLGVYGVAKVAGFPIELSLKALFILVCIFALLRGFLRYAEQSCNHYIAFKLLALIRGKVFGALRKLCPAKLEGRDKGNLISVITSDIELLEVFYAHTISPICIAFCLSLLMCLFIGSFHWKFGLIAGVAYFVTGVIIPLLTSKSSGEHGNNFRNKSGELSTLVLDNLRGLFEILQYGQGHYRLEEMNRKTDQLSEDEERLKRGAGYNMAVTNTVILLWDFIMLFVAVWLYMDGTVDLTGVLIPTVALMSSYGPVVALANLGSTLQNTFAAGNRVLDILEETPVVEELHGFDDIAFDGVSAKNLSFSYEKEKVLDDVTVDIPKGRIVGLVGRSGSGKSTVLKLFMRFWKVQEGKVNISHTDIERVNTANLRKLESFVTQETHLFTDSIRNNLRIAKLDATDEEIEIACKKASIHDFIMSLPEGYETKVGELGDTLSGGEKQRIGLARAFLHDAPFMLLDEPTSNLDSLNEAVILQSLHKERENKTVVLVSHRLSTMRIADEVYSVEDGRVS